MKNRKLFKLLWILVPAVLVVGVVFRLKVNKDVSESRVYRHDAGQRITVSVDTVNTASTGLSWKYPGIFMPYRETKVSSEIQGKLTAVMFREGQFVREGQALIELDHSLLDLQRQSAGLQIRGLELDVARYRTLSGAEAIQGVQLEKAELGLEAARIQLATLEEQLEKSTIRAPFDGIITAKLTEEGAYAAPGVPLVQLTDISRLLFTVQVSENELSWFDPSGEYRILPDALPDMYMQGKLTMTGSKADPAGRFPVQFTVSNTPDRKLRSGMFGRVILETSPNELPVVPVSAITGPADDPRVFVVEEGRARSRIIVLAGQQGDNAFISKGLRAGEVIVSGGIINLRDGALVRVP